MESHFHSFCLPDVTASVDFTKTLQTNERDIHFREAKWKVAEWKWMLNSCMFFIHPYWSTLSFSFWPQILWISWKSFSVFIYLWVLMYLKFCGAFDFCPCWTFTEQTKYSSTAFIWCQCPVVSVFYRHIFFTNHAKLTAHHINTAIDQ